MSKCARRTRSCVELRAWTVDGKVEVRRCPRLDRQQSRAPRYARQRLGRDSVHPRHRRLDDGPGHAVGCRPRPDGHESARGFHGRRQRRRVGSIRSKRPTIRKVSVWPPRRGVNPRAHRFLGRSSHFSFERSVRASACRLLLLSGKSRRENQDQQERPAALVSRPRKARFRRR